jgi:chaperonin GroES
MISPTKDRVVIIPEQRQNVSEGGIHLPGQENIPTGMGKIYKVGPDCVTMKPNDDVMFNAFEGSAVEFKGRQYIIMKEEEVLAVIEKE